MWRTLEFLFLLALLICSVHTKSLNSYDIDEREITVSGLSSGACMATQYHVAHSSMIKGAAIIAGCPYYCANANAAVALQCMDGFAYLPELYAATLFAELTQSIDSTRNLQDALVWLFSGSEDTVVSTESMQNIQEYYNNYVSDTKQIISNFDEIQAAHGWPTNGSGLKNCSQFDSPFVNNCTFSASGQFLQHFYGSLSYPVAASGENLLSFDQSLYTPGLTAASVSMDQTGFVYVPTACQQGESCKLHICFHGCEQGFSYVQKQFVQENQLNNWAESNHIIVLYPQASPTAIINPYGCWDWWGYTGVDYASKLASQISTVNKMVQTLIG